MSRKISFRRVVSMWLEVGCPFCSTILTFPRSVEGRSARCPECDKSYLIPVPNAATVAAAQSALKPVAPLAEAEPVAASLKTRGIASAPSGLAGVVAANAAAAARLKPAPAASEAELREDTNSPLPQLPILTPPQRSADGRIVGNSAAAASPYPARQTPAASAPGTQPPILASGGVGSSSAADRSRAAPASPPTERQRPSPVPSPSPNVAPSAESQEAQLRMRRTEVRALANLIIFLAGTAAMVAFAWVIIKFSRRR